MYVAHEHNIRWMSLINTTFDVWHSWTQYSTYVTQTQYSMYDTDKTQHSMNVTHQHNIWCMSPINPTFNVCHAWTQHVSWQPTRLNTIHSLLHLQCYSISISNLNLLGFFPTERGKRDLENNIIDWDLRMKKSHSKCSSLYHFVHTFLLTAKLRTRFALQPSCAQTPKLRTHSSV